jgi:hypothetical protein
MNTEKGNLHSCATLFRPRHILMIGVAFGLTSAADAAHIMNYTTDFVAFNSGAPLSKVGLNPTASGRLTYDKAENLLRVRIQGSGFEPGIPHVGHIHGNLVNPMVTGSGALDSFTPTLAQDAAGDGDGFIELFEGQTTYGPILFNLMNVDANLDGIVDYDMTFDLDDPNAPFGFINPLDRSQGRYGISDVAGLTEEEFELREMVIHGLTVPPGIGIDNPNQEPPLDDEINGRNIFAPDPGPGGEIGNTIVFPVASGELVVSAIPEPASWAMMIGGFGLIGGALRARRRTVSFA